MKKIILFLIGILFSFSLYSCSQSNPTEITTPVSEIGFEKVHITSKSAKEAFTSYPKGNQSDQPLDPAVTVDSRLNIQILEVAYNGEFSLVIDINNPNKRTINEIKIVKYTGNDTYTFKEGQIVDYDTNKSTTEFFFYANENNDRIYIDLKLDEEQPNEEAQFGVEEITYIADGVIISCIPEATQNFISAHVIDILRVEDFKTYIPSIGNYDTTQVITSKEDLLAAYFGVSIYNKFDRGIIEIYINITVTGYDEFQDHNFDSSIRINVNTNEFDSSIPKLTNDIDYSNAYFRFSDYEIFTIELGNLVEPTLENNGYYIIEIEISCIEFNDGRKFTDLDMSTSIEYR